MLETAPAEEMPSSLEPMLAKPGRIPESDSDEWAYEIKWDGIRALGYADHGRWWMHSRRLEDVTARYPELAPIGEALADRSAVLDGEVVALDPEGRPRFQLIQSRMGLTSPAAIRSRMAQTPVDYVIFDLLHLDGHSVRELPYVRAPRAARGARARRTALADPPLPPRWRRRACWRRRATRAWRASSRSAATAPTGRAGAAASGSRSGSGAGRSS